MLRTVHASVLNLDPAGKGFDAFASSESGQLVALCDGANSCLGSGHAARWLCASWVLEQPERALDAQTWQARLKDRHEQMQIRHPGTGSTLAFAHLHDKGLTLGNLGDSYLKVYHHAGRFWNRWRFVQDMPRDLDENGHPSQMAGSAVCQAAHLMELPPLGSYLLVFMSDGAGNYWTAGDLLDRLQIISSQHPSAEDLGYFCNTLAQHSLDLGSDDDASVALVWCHFKN